MITGKAIFFLFIAWLLLGCSVDREANDRAVEKLKQQLVNEKFDEIYQESDSITRDQLTKDQFVEWFKEATAKLKRIDPDINWHRDPRGSPEEGVYRDENWSSLNLERNGRSVNVQLTWARHFALCGISISGDIPEGGIDFRHCD